MASPFKTFVLRYPCQAAAVATGRNAAAAGLVASLPKASFSTAARSVTSLTNTTPFRQQCVAAVIPKTFARANSSQAAVPAEPAQTGAAPLDWNTFFDLRLKRRRVQLVFSFASSMLGGGFGAIVLSSGVGELVTEKIALDPIVTLGLATMSFAALGWLAGPSIGSQVFWLTNRKWKQQMTKKEAEFFARIKKHRVDPSNSSAGNPVPDFYGEKIQSVSGYRRWLKDQKAFNKKKTANFL